MRQIILYLLGVCLITSCSKVETHNAMFQLDEATENKGLMSELLTSVEYIPLETNDNCLLDALSKQLYRKEYFYASSNGEIMKFNKEGRFVGKLSRLGNAAFEYASIVDYDVVHRDGNTEIWVAHSKGISRYDAETFDFIGLIKLSCPVTHLKYVSDDTIILQTASEQTFCLCDINGEIRNQILDKDPANLSHGLLQFIPMSDGVYCILAGTDEAVRYNSSLDVLEVVHHTTGFESLLTREKNREYMDRFGYLNQPVETVKAFTSVVTFREKGGKTLLFLRTPKDERLFVKNTQGWNSYLIHPNPTLENDLLPGVSSRFLLTLASCDGDDCFIQSIPASMLDGMEINGKVIHGEDNPVIMRYLLK